MKKSLRNIVLAGSVGLAGCATHLDTPYLASDMTKVSNTQISYNLPLTNIAGTLFATKEAAVRKPEEWGYIFTRLEDSKLVEDRNQRRLDLSSRLVYVPVQFDGDNDNKPDNQVTLDTTGDLAIKAELNLPKAEGLAGITSLTEDSVRYFAPTPVFAGKDQVYTVKVNYTSGKPSTALLIPVRGSQIITDLSTGQLTIRNPEHIYVLNEVKVEDYNQQRIDFVNNKVAGERADAQAREDKRKLESLRMEGKIIPSLTIPDKK